MGIDLLLMVCRLGGCFFFPLGNDSYYKWVKCLRF